MRKILSICVVILLMFGFASATEGTLFNLIDTLNEEIPFGYTIDQKISVEEISVNKIVIKSPVIQDELGNIIKKYTIMFSQYPLAEIFDTISLIDEAREKTFEFTTVGTDVLMELTSLTDGISPSNVYYLSVIPKDENGVLGEISHNEIWFKLATQAYGEGTYTDEPIAHTAAGANMKLANITHTISNNNATLRWTAIGGSDKVDIFLNNPTSSSFERLASVNMSDENYSFLLTRNGEHILRFVPNNDGIEYDYSFMVEGVTSSATATTPTTKPTIGAIPATGPKENVLIVLAISVVLYMVYRRVKSKAKVK